MRGNGIQGAELFTDLIWSPLCRGINMRYLGKVAEGASSRNDLNHIVVC